MDNDENDLFERLELLMKIGKVQKYYDYPSVQEIDIVHAEAIIGFDLPPLLKRIYLALSNGGFGPGDGLFPLYNREDPNALQSDSLVTTYLALRSLMPEQFTTYWQNSEGDEGEVQLNVWPKKILTLCDWGCNIYSCINCSQQKYPVFRLDHNASVRRLVLEAPSFQQWLAGWLDSIESI